MWMQQHNVNQNFFADFVNQNSLIYFSQYFIFHFAGDILLYQMGKKIQKKVIPKQIVVGFRIFQKVKFRKYILMFPRLRQSEIVEKILKQWDAMDEKAKINFKNQHYDVRYADFYNQDCGSLVSSSSSSSSPSQLPIKKPQIIPQAKVRVFKEKSTQKGKPQYRDIHTWQYDRQHWAVNEIQGNDGSAQSSSGYSIKIQQKKPTKDYRYHTFVKYYHQRLSKQHPTWSQDQYTTIINMFWQNAKKKNKRTRIAKIHKFDTPEPFKYWQNRNRPLNLSEVQKMWTALPRKAKSFWSGKYDHLSAFKLKDFNPYILKKTNISAEKQSQIIAEKLINSDNPQMNQVLMDAPKQIKINKAKKLSPAELQKSLQDWK